MGRRRVRRAGRARLRNATDPVVGKRMSALRTDEGESLCLPTPSASSYGSNRGGAAGRMWPTPSVKGNHNRAGLSARSGDGLATAVNRAEGRTWPTPTAIPGGRGCGLGSAGPAPVRESWWATEPDVGRVAYGVPSGVDRLWGLGNAVVPACAEVVGLMLLELERARVGT